jgi:pyruvate/2-oxoglutarate/acetoin dehydrogenase E1 component
MTPLRFVQVKPPLRELFVSGLKIVLPYSSRCAFRMWQSSVEARDPVA